MNEGHVSRRQFFTSAIAAAGATALTAGRALADSPPLLTETYERLESPAATVAYPESWFLTPTLISDLLNPVELFSVSSEPLSEEAEDDFIIAEPDYTRLSPNGVLITVRAIPLVPGEQYLPGLDPAAGLAFSQLSLRADDYTFPAYSKSAAWYLGKDYGYEVRVFSGCGKPDMMTAAAIISTVNVQA